MLATATLCLALNVFYEARGESFYGQLAVAQVTLNRAGGRSERVCRVVYAKNQFSWTRDGRHIPNKSESWRTAQRIAQIVLARELDDVTEGATHFHAKRVRPQWAKLMQQTASYGNHIFYRAA